MSKNQNYLKGWDDYSKARPRWHAILCPITIDIDEDGKITRSRMSAPDVQRLHRDHGDDIPDIMRTHPEFYENPDHIFDDYYKFFGPDDMGETPARPSPLDLKTKRPVWYLFHLPKRSWKFSKHMQISVENDRDDIFRNFRKICTMDNRNVLLVENKCRSNPKGLKYNLHFTIRQKQDGTWMGTDMIIDPGGNNGNSGWPPDPGSGDSGTLPA